MGKDTVSRAISPATPATSTINRIAGNINKAAKFGAGIAVAYVFKGAQGAVVLNPTPTANPAEQDPWAGNGGYALVLTVSAALTVAAFTLLAVVTLAKRRCEAKEAQRQTRPQQLWTIRPAPPLSAATVIAINSQSITNPERLGSLDASFNEHRQKESPVENALGNVLRAVGSVASATANFVSDSGGELEIEVVVENNDEPDSPSSAQDSVDVDALSNAGSLGALIVPEHPTAAYVAPQSESEEEEPVRHKPNFVIGEIIAPPVQFGEEKEEEPPIVLPPKPAPIKLESAPTYHGIVQEGLAASSRPRPATSLRSLHSHSSVASIASIAAGITNASLLSKDARSALKNLVG